jgi:hypothetical protein
MNNQFPISNREESHIRGSTFGVDRWLSGPDPIGGSQVNVLCLESFSLVSFSPVSFSPVSNI